MRSQVERLAEWRSAYSRLREEYIGYADRPPRLVAPRTFSEKVQWRKLFDDHPLLKVFCDKLATRAHLSDLGFADLLTPLIWVGDDPDDIPFDQIVEPAVLKSTRGSEQYAVLTPGQIDRAAVVEKARGWMSWSFGRKKIEPGYIPGPQRLMIEGFVGDVARPPDEHKLFVFDGALAFVQMVESDPARDISTAYFSPEWIRLPWRGLTPPIAIDPPEPAVFRRARQVAERVGRNLDHIRVDVYDCGDKLYIGELTPYSWSGFQHIFPPETDAILGGYWHLRRPLPRALRRLLFTWWSDI